MSHHEICLSLLFPQIPSLLPSLLTFLPPLLQYQFIHKPSACTQIMHHRFMNQSFHPRKDFFPYLALSQNLTRCSLRRRDRIGKCCRKIFFYFREWTNVLIEETHILIQSKASKLAHSKTGHANARRWNHQQSFIDCHPCFRAWITLTVY